MRKVHKAGYKNHFYKKFAAESFALCRVSYLEKPLTHYRDSKVTCKRCLKIIYRNL